MTSIEDVRARIDGIEGWLSDSQVEALHDVAAATRPGDRIVEIGSFRGRSTVVLAASAPAGVEVVAIDPHAGNDRGPQEIAGFDDEAAADHRVFLANLERAGVRGRVRHVRAFSHDALSEVDGPVDVLFVDGAHRFAPARDDIRAWGARVRPGGVLLVHDAFSSVGVTLALLVELSWRGRFRFERRARSLAVYRADLPPTPRARGANLARHLAQLPWFAANVGLKVLLTLGLGKVLARLGRRAPDWPY